MLAYNPSAGSTGFDGNETMLPTYWETKFNPDLQPRARIGILSNEQNDCNSCDSRIGFGTGGKPDYSNSCGNVAAHQADNGDKNIKTMGYILVQ